MRIWNYFLRDRAAKSDGAIGGGTLPLGKRDVGRINKNDLAFQLARKILKAQRLVATYLNSKTRGISKSKIRLSLVCFIALGCMYCLYLILSAVLLFLP